MGIHVRPCRWHCYCRAIGLLAMRPLAVARFRRNAAGLTPIRRLSGRSLARSKRWWAQCLSIRPGVRQWAFARRPTSLARGTTLEPRLTRQLTGQRVTRYLAQCKTTKSDGDQRALTHPAVGGQNTMYNGMLLCGNVLFPPQNTLTTQLPHFKCK